MSRAELRAQYSSQTLAFKRETDLRTLRGKTMSSESLNTAEESRRVEEATTFLLDQGVPAVTREFRLRQEFFRHGWDVRVRDQSGYWAVYATKPGYESVEVAGSTESNTLRLALSAALKAGELADHG